MKFATALLAVAVGTVSAFAPAHLQSKAHSTALSGSVRSLDRLTGRSQLDPVVVDRYNAIPYPKDLILAEYVWVDADGKCRSKTRTLPAKRYDQPDSRRRRKIIIVDPNNNDSHSYYFTHSYRTQGEAVESLPKWNFDGSSTGQAPGDDSEVILKPQRIFKDPFRLRHDGIDNILVMCDCYTPGGEPLPTNHRAKAMQYFAPNEDQEIWFGLEQEFTLFNLDEKTPLGWPEGGMPSRPQGPYYCSAGPENNFGRSITDSHYKACLYAGINISGVNGEVMPGQQEYQVGPCVGIDAGDQLMMSRYILQRVCEDFQVYCTLHPKPIVQGDWNGAGMHTNVSTKGMREEGGLEVIKKAIYKLGAKHADHIAVYGEDNDLRLTGKHETASIEKFSFGVANRGASVRIGRDTEAEGKGYFEDRRPSSNADPYIVTGKIMETIMSDIDAPVIVPLDKAQA